MIQFKNFNKKLLSAAALSLSLCFATSGKAQTQELPPGHPPVNSAFMAHHAKMGFEHALMQINITQAQKDKIFDIRHKNEPSLYKTHQQIRAVKEQINELRMKQNFDIAKARGLYTQLANLEAESKIAKFEQDAEIYNVLTNEQKAELKKLCDTAHARYKEKKQRSK